MSKKPSTWRNRSDGKTVRRNIVAAHHTSRPVELIASPAMRVLSRAAHLVLLRIELELRHHAGQANGKLIVTDLQFIEFGVHKNSIAAALRELEALGIIRIRHGRGGNAEHCEPNRFLLNYLCGAIDAHEEVTNAWGRFKTLEEAEDVASAARTAKDPVRVAWGKRNAAKKSIFRPRKVGVKPPPETGGENGQFPPPETGGTSPPPETEGTLDISGRGGDDNHVSEADPLSACSRSAPQSTVASEHAGRRPDGLNGQSPKLKPSPQLERCVGSATDVAVRDAAIAISFALQFGARLEDIACALSRDGSGRANGPAGRALDLLVAEKTANSGPGT
jgi:hypothetical protein